MVDTLDVSGAGAVTQPPAGPSAITCEEATAVQPIVPFPRQSATYTYDPVPVAVQLAQEYFRIFARHAGMPWDHGNDIEVEILVVAIIDAARKTVDAR
jgi:hypothetical protein